MAQNLPLLLQTGQSVLPSVYEIFEITALSLFVSGTAVLVASAIGIITGTFIALTAFRGKRFVFNVINALMGTPPVFAGLILFLLLSSSGPFASLKLVFTSAAMIVVQVVIVTPIITGITMATVANVQTAVKDTAISLGATRTQLLFRVLSEASLGLLTAVVVGFGRAVSEVGGIIIVGGDIRGFTRTLTTGIIGLVRVGEFDFALLLGLILIALSFSVNYVLTHLQLRGLRFK